MASKHSINKVPAIPDDLSFPGSIRRNAAGVNVEDHYREFSHIKPGSKSTKFDSSIKPESKSGRLKSGAGYEGYL